MNGTASSCAAQAPAGGLFTTARRTTRAGGARWPAAATGRRPAASDRKKRLRLQKLKAESLGQLDQPVIGDPAAEHDFSRASLLRHDLDMAEADAEGSGTLQLDLLDLLLRQVEVLDPVEPGDDSRVFALGELRHQLSLDVARHRAGRSEERRVGKECRSRGSVEEEKTNNTE